MSASISPDKTVYVNKTELETVHIKSSEQKAKLTIYLENGYEYVSNLWIFDNNNRLWYNPGSKETENPDYQLADSWRKIFHLPLGTYVVRVAIDGLIEDNTVILDKDKARYVGRALATAGQDSLKSPVLYSAALLKGNIAYTDYDYYREAAVEISTMDTFNPLATTQTENGLFIFLRYPNRENYQSRHNGKPYWNKFSVYDAQHKLMVRFPEGTYKDWGKNKLKSSEGKSGFIGFSAKMKPGLYFIEYSGKEGRTIPVYVYEGWYTQIFMMVAEQPLFGTMKLFLSKKRKFDPADRYHAYVDTCLSKLQHNDFTLDRELLQNVAHGKFESPMLGLLGAFIYLSSKETKDDQLFKTILRNLQNRILMNSANSPDIYALNFLSYEHFGETLSPDVNPNVKGTPMLRIAYDTIRRAAARDSWVMPPGSLNERIAERQCFDAPFNTFSPLKNAFYTQFSTSPTLDLTRTTFLKGFPKAETNLKDLLHGTTRKKKYNRRISGRTTGDESFGRTEELMQQMDEHLNVNLDARPDDFLSRFVFPSDIKRLSMLLSKPQKIGWVGVSIIQELLHDNGISSGEIAAKINIPVSTIERVRHEWDLYLRPSDRFRNLL